MQYATEIEINIMKGFAESYMLGEVSSPDLTKFFEVSKKYVIWVP